MLTQQIANNIIDAIAEIPDRDTDGDVSNDREVFCFDKIELDAGVIEAFQRFVETLTAERDIRHIGELMADIQIMLARYSTFDFSIFGTRETLYGLLILTGKVRFLNNELFNYARFLKEDSFGVVHVISINEAWDGIIKSSFELIFRVRNCENLISELNARLQRYKDNGFPPWNEVFGE